MAGKAAKMYGESPELKHDEGGKVTIGKANKKATEADADQSGTDGMHVEKRHTHERREMHHRHIHEHMAMHHKHEMEHSTHSGTAEKVHDRHELDYGEMHSRHHGEMKKLHAKHEKEMGEHGTASKGGKEKPKAEKENKE